MGILGQFLGLLLACPAGIADNRQSGAGAKIAWAGVLCEMNPVATTSLAERKSTSRLNQCQIPLKAVSRAGTRGMLLN
jgi:hypothetical protein